MKIKLCSGCHPESKGVVIAETPKALRAPTLPRVWRTVDLRALSDLAEDQSHAFHLSIFLRYLYL